MHPVASLVGMLLAILAGTLFGGAEVATNFARGGLAGMAPRISAPPPQPPMPSPSAIHVVWSDGNSELASTTSLWGLTVLITFFLGSMTVCIWIGHVIQLGNDNLLWASATDNADHDADNLDLLLAPFVHGISKPSLPALAWALDALVRLQGVRLPWTAYLDLQTRVSMLEMTSARQGTTIESLLRHVRVEDEKKAMALVSLSTRISHLEALVVAGGAAIESLSSRLRALEQKAMDPPQPPSTNEVTDRSPELVALVNSLSTRVHELESRVVTGPALATASVEPETCVAVAVDEEVTPVDACIAEPPSETAIDGDDDTRVATATGAEADACIAPTPLAEPQTSSSPSLPETVAAPEEASPVDACIAETPSGTVAVSDDDAGVATATGAGSDACIDPTPPAEPQEASSSSLSPLLPPVNWLMPEDWERAPFGWHRPTQGKQQQQQQQQASGSEGPEGAKPVRAVQHTNAATKTILKILRAEGDDLQARADAYRAAWGIVFPPARSEDEPQVVPPPSQDGSIPRRPELVTRRVVEDLRSEVDFHEAVFNGLFGEASGDRVA